MTNETETLLLDIKEVERMADRMCCIEIRDKIRDALKKFELREKFKGQGMKADELEVTMPEVPRDRMDCDNVKEWQNPDNWVRDLHTGRVTYQGPPPPPECIADRLVEYTDGKYKGWRFDPATGIHWPPRTIGMIPEDIRPIGR